MLEVFPDQTAFTEKQQRMMPAISEAVKKNTAERNRRIAIVKSILNREMIPKRRPVNIKVNIK